MPMHDYTCDKCKKRFEIIVPLKDNDKEIPCKYCGRPLKKQLSVVSFTIKG